MFSAAGLLHQPGTCASLVTYMQTLQRLETSLQNDFSIDSQQHETVSKLISRCYKPCYLVKCLLVAVCIHHVVLMIPWPGLTPVRVAVWCTLLTSCLLVGEGGPSYLRHPCLCPMGTATAS